jgi:hypothetical protein
MPTTSARCPNCCSAGPCRCTRRTTIASPMRASASPKAAACASRPSMRASRCWKCRDIPAATSHSSARERLFCGDTLFSLGCGRLFEGTPEQMLDSLDRLAALDGELEVCCGHEYTLANARFALEVEPENEDLRQRYAQAARQRAGAAPHPAPARWTGSAGPTPSCAATSPDRGTQRAPAWDASRGTGQSPSPRCARGKDGFQRMTLPRHQAIAPGDRPRLRR